MKTAGIGKRFRRAAQLGATIGPCGKFGHPSRRKANAHRKRLVKRPAKFDPKPGWAVECYYCNACMRWHVGHSRYRQTAMEVVA